LSCPSLFLTSLSLSLPHPPTLCSASLLYCCLVPLCRSHEACRFSFSDMYDTRIYYKIG
jgi:hypothetical protein